MVATVGRAEVIPEDWIKLGGRVIDVGINRLDVPEKSEDKARHAGDVEYKSCAAVAAGITSVHGGVGSMIIACLLANTLTAVIDIGTTQVQSQDGPSVLAGDGDTKSVKTWRVAQLSIKPDIQPLQTRQRIPPIG